MNRVIRDLHFQFPGVLLGGVEIVCSLKIGSD